MAEYTERIYRKRVRAAGLVSFKVAVKETDLWVSADRDLERETRDLIVCYRRQLESYIQGRPEFLTALDPLPPDPCAPALVQEMLEVTRPLGVGPMASVAGSLAQWVGRDLLARTGQVIVENGGDIYLSVNRSVTVSLFAGRSPLSERVGLVIRRGQMPLGVCSSSGTVGHSMSGGAADAVCVLARSAALADGAATSLCNRMKKKGDLERVASEARDMGGVLGVVAIMGHRMVTWGEVELAAL
ncbi:MAG: UPF0280 family protein [Deltaproteobacteria bacterium]|nr:UPF0280 family protein [Deltaproteobacteria bacterium]